MANNKQSNILEGLSWIGILGIIVFACVLIFGDVSKNGKYTASIACIIGLAYPICKTLLSSNSDEAIGSGMFTAIGGLVLAIFWGLVFKKSTSDGFILDFLNALISKGFLWFYLILLLLSSYFATKDKNITMIISGILVGFLTPVIIAGVVMLVLIVVGLIIAFALSKSSNGTSTLTNTIGNKSESGINKQSLNQTQNTNTVGTYYWIVWKSGEHGTIYDFEKIYPKGVSASQITADLKKINHNAILLDFKLSSQRNAHDHWSNYIGM